MKNIVVLIVLLTALITNCGAQYRIAAKGTPVPYDSAVIIELSTYRLETAQMLLGDSLILSFRSEIDLLNTSLSVYKQQMASREEETKLLISINDRNQEMIVILSLLYNDLEKSKNKRWYKQPGTWVVIGVVVIVKLL